MRSCRFVILFAAEGPDRVLTSLPDRGAPSIQVLGLARALAASPLWSEMPPAALVVRRDDAPMLAVIGEFNPEECARLDGIRQGVEEHLIRLRYLSYVDAEAACERLAKQLVDRMGRKYLRDARFVAVPRGGFFVLGMLSYALGLNHEQCAPLPPDDDAPVVIVDDCAYTGYRAGRMLERLRGRSVVFAHLYSHPDLRASLEAREAQILAAVAAGDLHDYAPSDFGSAEPSWRERSMTVSPQPCYWSGRTERICFAWAEPDYNFWNPVTEQLESGWYLLDPDLCLKNRPGLDRKPIDLQVQPPTRGAFRQPAGVLAGKFAGKLVVGSADSGRSVLLNPVAAEMWTALLESGSSAEALKRIANRFDADAATIESDMATFVDEMLAKGLLQCRDRAIA
ncbi:MAG: PqqD family peptide modification chaperone [Hyphomicrobiales bacterium]|nr:PqqD family peptide modification chaperone [Hyphomicrobiales bacterium]